MAAGRAMWFCHQLDLFGKRTSRALSRTQDYSGSRDELTDVHKEREFWKGQQRLLSGTMAQSFLILPPLPPPNFMFLPASSRVGLAG